MASKGADVILGCRDEKKGKAAAESISNTLKGIAKVQHRRLDLTDFRSIRKFVSEIDRCDILINNAGAMFPKYELVPYGNKIIEKTLLTNYLGPFYLTMKLMPVLLKRSSNFPTQDGISSSGIAFERRIVNVGSRLEKNSSFKGLSPPHEAINEILRDAVIHGRHGNSADPGKMSYNMWTAYANSKLCNLLFTFELSRKLSEGSYGSQLEGLGTTALSVNAGGQSSNLVCIKFTSISCVHLFFSDTRNGQYRFVPMDALMAACVSLPCVALDPSQSETGRRERRAGGNIAGAEWSDGFVSGWQRTAASPHCFFRCFPFERNIQRVVGRVAATCGGD